jgi:hypothetical protein
MIARVSAARPTAPRLRLPRLSQPQAALALLLVPMLCAAALLLVPRSVAPELLPVLVLPAAEVAAALAADTREARKAPSTPIAQELRTLLLAQGAAEVQGQEDADQYQARRERLTKLAAELAAAAGEPAVRALRAEQVESTEAALVLRMPFARAREVLGALPTMLARDGATYDGTLLVAPFVLHTLAKARINVLFGRRPDHDLVRVEQLALYGFQALHGERQPLARRVEALERYARVGGGQAEEALAVMLARNGEPDAALAVLSALSTRRFGLRTRNYALDQQDQAALARESH